MDPVWEVVLLTTLAAAALPLGAWLARIERLRPRWLERELRYGVVAFGGGILLSAVALVLVPEGAARVSLPAAMLCLCGGGVLFLLLDMLLARNDTPASQLTAALSDFLPEAVALGAAFARGESAGPLLAFLVAAQNLPEGFNAFRELRARSQLAPGRLLVVFALLIPLGPAAGLAGYFALADQPQLTGAIMLLASGGILYLTFQDIAPQARLDRHWGPPLGAVLGFAFGLLGQLLLDGGAA